MTPRSFRAVLAVIREELQRYRRMYRQAELHHELDPGDPNDRRERWYGAVRALERLLRRLTGGE